MPLLLRADLVLPGPAGQRLDNGAVLVEGDTITAVGPYHRVRTDLGVARYESDDLEELHFPVLTPGLINAHVHLAFDETDQDPASAVKAGDDERVQDLMATHARQLLDAGVTTARDLGGATLPSIDLRDRIGSGKAVGPRLLVAGAPITPVGGHCWFLGGEVDPDDESLRAAVGERADAGADVLKVMASGGRMTSTGAPMWKSQFTLRQLRVLVNEAHTVGLPVAAHCHGADAIEDATSAGADTIEHCGWRTESGDFDRRDHVAQEMASRGTVVCPTPTPNWPRLAQKIGEDRADYYHHRVRWLDEHGVTVICGSDAGTRNAVFSDFVTSLHAFSHVGLSNSQVLEMATVTAARTLAVSSGALTPGRSADILALHHDPTKDLGALRYPARVICGGQQPRESES